jgi:hypothetical protein
MALTTAPQPSGVGSVPTGLPQVVSPTVTTSTKGRRPLITASDEEQVRGPVST